MEELTKSATTGLTSKKSMSSSIGGSVAAGDGEVPKDRTTDSSGSKYMNIPRIVCFV